ncbi:MAG: phosphatidate cytidylyltransferase [Rhodocyclaceae bacterium]
MLKTRVVTALCLAAGFFAVLFLLPDTLVAPVFAAIAALAGWEWAGLMKPDKPGAPSRFLFAGLVLLICLTLWVTPDAYAPLLWSLSVFFWLCIAPLWLLRRWRPGWLGYVLGLVLLVSAWAALMALYAHGPFVLVAVMALVWVADIAAYATGRTFGRHKLAPTISPGKTWEGVVGAVVGVLLYGLFVHVYLPEAQDWARLPFFALLLLLTALSIVGDLFESLIKRQANLKDSSQLLPGHGGILDRIDSQISTLPLAALTLYLLQ